MKNVLCAAALSALLLAACGGAEPGAGLEEPVMQDSASEALLESQPMGAQEVIASQGDQIIIRAGPCSYRLTVGYLPGFPPRYQYLLSRIPSRHCAQASVVLGTSYLSYSPLVTARGKRIVIAFSYKPTPSGAGSTFLSIQHVHPETLAVVRAETLAAGPGGFSNSVLASKLYFSGHRLVVEGSKNGFIPGELGSGSQYIAVFPHFLTSEEPPVVLAFEAP